MSRITWGTAGKRFYETGIDRGVVYPNGGSGVAWNGLLSVNESVSGGEAKPFFFDGYKYQNRAGPEDFEATIEAYTYPEEFELCNGTVNLGAGLFLTQQRRLPFGLCYRTKVGNDIVGDSYGYKLHLIYNALAAPTTKNYTSVDDTPEAIAFSWDITTKPVLVSGHKATPHIIIDTSKLTAPLLASLESLIYGTPDANPRLPLPAELITLFLGWPTLEIVDNGNGTFTAYGPDEMIQIINPNTFQITGATIINNGNGTFDATSS